MKKNILIYNPITKTGHLDSWLEFFIISFTNMGYKVSLVSPELSKSTKKICTDCGVNTLPWKYEALKTSDAALSIIESIIKKLPTFAKHYIGSSIRPKSSRPFFSWFIWHISAILKFFGIKENHIHFIYDTFNTRHLKKNEFINFSKHIQKTIQENNISPSIVFHTYLDMYIPLSPKIISEVDKTFNLPWGGVLFHVTNNLLTSKNAWLRCGDQFKGACFLDEKKVAIATELIPKKTFCFLPDITTTDALPIKPKEIEEIKRKARERTIIFFGGAIAPKKGIDTFCSIIERVDPDKYFFLIVGHVYTSTFTSELLERFYNLSSFENVFFKEGFIEDERLFNSYIEICDVIYANYIKFQSSSNTLAKAAAFKIPVLVSEKYLMGARVREFGIGITVPEENTDACLGALEILTQKKFDPINFNNYLSRYSMEIFTKNLSTFVTSAQYEK